MKADIRQFGRCNTTPEGHFHTGSYDCPIAPYCQPHCVTRSVLSDCYSFFSIFPSNRMTTLTTLPVTERPLFIATAPEVNLLCYGVFIAYRIPSSCMPDMEAQTTATETPHSQGLSSNEYRTIVLHFYSGYKKPDTWWMAIFSMANKMQLSYKMMSHLIKNTFSFWVLRVAHEIQNAFYKRGDYD